MMIDDYSRVRLFERWLEHYTSAPYAVAVHRCTSALTMCCEYLKVSNVSIPKKTYVEVPQAILRGGGRVFFDDRDWVGAYSLNPYPIWDSARRFTSGMFDRSHCGGVVCLSFHRRKILGATEGGAILTDNAEAAEWFRLARFGGRSEHVAPKHNAIRIVGWPCYMIPETAQALLDKALFLPLHNEDLPNDDYPDLSLIDWNGLWTEQCQRFSTESKPPETKTTSSLWPGSGSLTSAIGAGHTSFDTIPQSATTMPQT